MSIIERAKEELICCNFGEADSKVMIEILEKFFRQWDSGGAVSCAAPVLFRLIEGKPVGPLTGEDDEWHDVSEISGRLMFQNVRCSSVFKDAFRAYDIDVQGSPNIQFPYHPPMKY